MVGDQIARLGDISVRGFFGGRFRRGLGPVGLGRRLVVAVQDALDGGFGRFRFDLRRQVLDQDFHHFFGGLEHLCRRVGRGGENDIGQELMLHVGP